MIFFFFFFLQLKTDIRDALRDGLPLFRSHYEKLIQAQKSAFHSMAVAAEDLS